MGSPRPACSRRPRGLARIVALEIILLGCGGVLPACSSATREAPAAPAYRGTTSRGGAAIESPGASPERAERAEVQRGYATWYGASLAGHRMANGKRFDPDRMTAAHRTLPLGTWVEVRREDGSGSVRVEITDRGPFGHAGRIIDLSRAAADKIGIRKAGVAPVEVRVVAGP